MTSDHPTASRSQPLRGGHLNAVARQGGMVHKRYLGADAAGRRHAEHHALSRLDHALPVPAVLPGGDEESMIVELVEGVNGQVLIREGLADPVLRRCGEVLRLLQSLGTDPARDVLSGAGQVIVHGDFGPQNVLLDPGAERITAVIDWEFCHLGAPIEDLAWAEWTVRRHHPEAVAALPALFAGYSRTPHQSLRIRSTIRTMRGLRTLAARSGDVAAVALWDERLDDFLRTEREAPAEREIR